MGLFLPRGGSGGFPGGQGPVTCAAFAADVTGKWTAEVPGRGGNRQTNTSVFKADGAKLTGTLSRGRGGDVELTDGKKGAVSGDTIKFTRTMEGGQGGGQPVEFNARKAN